MTAGLLEAQSLRGGYGDGDIIRGLSLRLSPGTWTGIVGPNGCGKTTLLRMLARTLKPAGGSVNLDGEDIYARSYRDAARHIAVVPQSLALEFAFTVSQFVSMGRLPHLGRFSGEGSAGREVVQRCLEQAGVPGLADRVVTELSGGELQRVLIAQALAQEPDVLLLDEPTHHLDINHQLEVMDLIAVLKTEGLAVAAVLHDLNLAAYYCDELIMINDGCIAAEGQPARVLTAENVLRVFGVQTVVHRHPVTGRVSVTAVSAVTAVEPDGRSVHVICGSGTGVGLITGLRRRGLAVSVGVLNALDSDYELAQDLGLTVVAEAPFSNISDEAFRENLERAGASDAIVIAPTPFGEANLRNLEVALVARRQGVPVFVVDEPPFEERDFTAGQAATLRATLLDEGATSVDGEEGVWAGLEGMKRPTDPRAKAADPRAKTQDR